MDLGCVSPLRHAEKSTKALVIDLGFARSQAKKRPVVTGWSRTRRGGPDLDHSGDVHPVGRRLSHHLQGRPATIEDEVVRLGELVTE